MGACIKDTDWCAGGRRGKLLDALVAAISADAIAGLRVGNYEEGPIDEII